MDPIGSNAKGVLKIKQGCPAVAANAVRCCLCLRTGFPYLQRYIQRRRGLKSRSGRKVAILRQTVLTEDIMSAQNFNFAPKFPKVGYFNPKFCILTKIFRQQDNFPSD